MRARLLIAALAPAVVGGLVLTATPAPAAPAAPAAAVAARAAAAPLAVTTYNIEKPSSRRPWKPRRKKVAALLKQRYADVIAIQEANGPHRGARTKFPARDLDHLLGAYSAVRTRIDPKGRRDLSTTGRYLLYRPSRLVPGRNGELSLGSSSYAVWSQFTDRRTGRRLVVVNAHLRNGNNAARDRVRRVQTKRLVAGVRRISGGLPVVVAGDINSHHGHRSDAPRTVLRKAGWYDTYSVTRNRSRSSFSSNNQLRRKPPRKYMHPDAVFVPGGTRVTGWAQTLRLRGKKFVGTIPSDHNPVTATFVLR